MLGPYTEMFRLVHIAAMVCGLGLLASPAAAKVLKVNHSGPKGRVQAIIPKDGYSVVTVFRPKVPGLFKRIKQSVDSETTVVRKQIGPKDEEIQILFSSPVVRKKIKRRGRSVSLEIEYKTREENLRARVVKTLRVPVPSTFVGFRFDAAERLMRLGQLSDALSKYKILSEQYELRAWAQLRLADIALLGGDVHGACRRYASTSETFGVRISGLLARLRLQVLGCGWNKGPQADWDILLERADRIPGKIGSFLRREAIWAMNQVSRAEEVDLAISLVEGIQLRHKKLKNRLQNTKQVLLARAIRLPKKPIDTARMCYRHKQAIEVHSESYSLRYSCAQAYKKLNLVKQAIAELRFLRNTKSRRHSGALWIARRGNAQAAYTLAQVYNDIGDADYVYATLIDYQKRFGYPPPSSIKPEPPVPNLSLSKLKIGQLIDGLDRRVYMLERAIPNRGGSAAATNSKGGP